MICPYCHSKTQVTNSRGRAKSTQTWRRRACTACQAVWTTREELDISTTHSVQSIEGLEPFSRDQLFISIKESLQHRKTSLNDATALTDTIIAQVLALKQPLIKADELKNIAHRCLLNFDKTAAAVYKAMHT